MNLRNTKDNKKLLDEFNKHSKDMADIITKRSEILKEVNIAAGQIWEKANGKRIVVCAVNGQTIHYLLKSGKFAMQSQTQKKDTFVSEIYIYLGVAGDVFTNDFLNHDGREDNNTEDAMTAKKAMQGVRDSDGVVVSSTPYF